VVAGEVAVMAMSAATTIVKKDEEWETMVVEKGPNLRDAMSVELIKVVVVEIHLIKKHQTAIHSGKTGSNIEEEKVPYLAMLMILIERLLLGLS
jgi:hypothetical protein